MKNGKQENWNIIWCEQLENNNNLATIGGLLILLIVKDR
jgi:hypothetical protein